MEEHIHLGHNWYQYEIIPGIQDWILECIDECIDFVQPFSEMKLRAKRELNGDITYKVVFSYVYDEHYHMPVCYMLDLNHGKFKGNNMHYFVDNIGTRYCDIYPVFYDHLKFDDDSKYHQEKNSILRNFLQELDVPEFHVLTSKEKRAIIRKKKGNGYNKTADAVSATRNPRMPPNVRRKKNKHNLLRDIKINC